ncbi:MAG: AAA family ATPase, partial [Bacteroidaceae bacterium]|nr:AAA family ATPase [Bacteroidaceae bacterium]
MKNKTVYVCEECGQESVRWVGKCPACGRWNTMKELHIHEEKNVSPISRMAMAAAGADAEKAKAVSVHEIEAEKEPRMDLQDAELNRVLGGGLVPGSLVLLGGEPGIGKSTLVLQTIMRLKDRKVLYVSGEESARQIKLRANRLGGDANVLIYCETSLEKIFTEIANVNPDLVVIDSIQTISTEGVESSPGSLSQIRECAAALLKYAKG